MLIACPECAVQISDRAYDCPCCGYPLRERSKPKRRKRLPNGFGQITRLKDPTLRKPYRAMTTVGKDAYGKPICKLLKPQAYFKTYNEAYEALLENHKNPYDIGKDITMQELYDRWFKEWSKTVVTPNKASSVWKYCENIHQMLVRDVKAYHVKEIITACDKVSQRKNIKITLNMMFDYAIQYEIVDSNPARNCKLPRDVVKGMTVAKHGHIPYEADEIDYLWDNRETEKLAKFILVQCMSGWRPQELVKLRIENINLDDWTFSGGMKTESGKNRIVPIHKLIRPIVAELYWDAVKNNRDCLFDIKTTNSLNYHFTKLPFQHRPHDGRVHFVTLAKKYNVDEYAIKYMVGHVITDITENIYTKRSVEWLTEEMEKIRGLV